MPRPPHLRDWLALFVLTILWGSSFLMNELALGSFPPAVLAAGRIVIAAFVMYGYMRLVGATLPRPGRAWLPVTVIAIFGNVLPFNLIAWAQQHIDSSLAGVLMAVMPLFVLTLAHFFVPGSRLTRHRAAGFVLGFTGVAFVLGPDVSQGLVENAELWGAIAVLGAALSYSVGTIYTRRIGPGDPVRRSAGMFIVAGVLASPAALLGFSGIAAPGIGAVAALLVLGVLATGFAAVLFFRLIEGPGPTFVSFVNYLVPGWAVIAGALFLDEALSPAVFIGLALILSGIAVSEFGARVSRVTLRLLRRGMPSRQA